MSEREESARILFVAAGPPLLRGVARLLGDASHQVIEAATGQDGLRLAQEWKPDLVLLDVMLPDLNGVEVCRRIKADPQLATTHVVILSATRAESGVWIFLPMAKPWLPRARTNRSASGKQLQSVPVRS